MTLWVQFEHRGEAGFGTLEGDAVTVHRGDLFADAAPTATVLPLGEVRLLMPVRPSKMIALWNNFHELGAKLGVSAPSHPLYFLKAPNAFADPGAEIRRPASYAGRVVYEGELGIVIGRTCRDASPDEALACVFGYTCVNDVTASDLLNEEPSFPQWVRAKGFDGFGPLGPAVATGLDPATLRARTILDGTVRQDYPIADMVFPVPELVSRLSRDMTLFPGDVISCGTSVGVGTMKGPANTVEVEIEGIGRLRNTFVG